MFIFYLTQKIYTQILKENEYLRLMNGKEVFHNFDKISNINVNIDIEIKNLKEENIPNEDLRKPMIQCEEEEITIEEITEKIKILNRNHFNSEIKSEYQERELITFDEQEIFFPSNFQLDSIEENYIEDMCLEKLDSINFCDENIVNSF